MTPEKQDKAVRAVLEESAVVVESIQRRSFPGEEWIIIYVAQSSLPLAQSLAATVETKLNAGSTPDHDSVVVAFRAAAEDASSPSSDQTRGRLFDRNVDQLVQLLEARSRTSDALPSLRYVEDPRASLSAVCASRHHLVYGRRGVGKTAILLEAKAWAERQGYAAAWINAHTLRNLDPYSAALTMIEQVMSAVIQNAGSSTAAHYETLRGIRKRVRAERQTKTPDLGLVAEINQAMRPVLREGVMRVYLFVDDFYLYPIAEQPQILDLLSASLRDCNGWIKVASIERLSRPFEPSTRIGMELPHDATAIDLDVTLEEPGSAQRFLESVLENYLTAVGIASKNRIAKPEALGRLVLASGGVPRDYLNLIAASVVVARGNRPHAREIGREDVAIAAGIASKSKKRDLEQDVDIDRSTALLGALERLTSQVKGAGFTFFRVDSTQKSNASYEVLAQLVDLRFAHLVQASLSDKHRPGVRYEAYLLDLSEYSDVRLKRGLQVLDLDDGRWRWRQTGRKHTSEVLTGTKLRDRLRDGPLIDVAELTP